MLVLSRRPGERIQLGVDVVLTVVRVGPNQVRLAIDAPANVPVWRAELLEADLPHGVEMNPKGRGADNERL